MKERFSGKVCMITGAASGIGRGCAVRLAREGARLVLCDLAASANDRLARELEDAGTEVLAMTFDVTSREQAEGAVARAMERFGRLDVLVNSAGITPRSLPADTDWEAAWDRVMAINVKGTLVVSHAAVEAMGASGGGAIVNLASIMGLAVYPAHFGFSQGFNAYPHSKGAVIQITRDLGVSLAREGIRANAVCPGFVYTPLTKGITESPSVRTMIERETPIGRLAEVDEVVSVILFLASDEASYVTAAAWTVDGGYSAT